MAHPLTIVRCFLALVALGAPRWAAADANSSCTPLVTVLQQQPGHEIFARALQATGFEFDDSKKYTVLLPSDGPADASATDGTEGFGGFLRAFGYDVSSVESIAESEDIDNLGAILRHMILPGAFPSGALISMAAEAGGPTDIRTLFDTEADAEACSHLKDDTHMSHFPVSDSGPGNDATADGDVRVAIADGGDTLSIIDDSDFTSRANITGTDIAACGGSIVHTMQGWLSPCCLGDGDGECTTAPFAAQQQEDAVAVEETADTGQAVHGVAVMLVRLCMCMGTLLSM